MLSPTRLALARTVAVAALLALVAAATPAPANAQDDAAVERQHKQLAETLASKRISLDFDETRLPDALEYLGQRANISIVVQPSALEDVEDEVVSLTLSNVTAGNALRILLDYVALTYTFRHGVVWVTTPEEAWQGRTVLRIYDVRDLTFKIKDFVGPRIRLRGNDDGSPGIYIDEYDDDDDLEIEVDTLEDIIPEVTGGDSWHENPNASVMQVMGMLLIRQTPEVHREIAGLLAQLKSNR